MTIKSVTRSLRRNFGSTRKKTPKDQPSSTTTTPSTPPKTNTPSSNSSIVTPPDGNQDTLLNGIGPYRFHGPLGSGKFSRVVLARHRDTDKQVAIKVHVFYLFVLVFAHAIPRSLTSKCTSIESCHDWYERSI